MNLRAEKRQHPRVGINWPVVIKTDQGSFEGVALNISCGGAFIRCWKALRLADVFKMVIHARPSNRILTVSADVIWSDTSSQDDHLSPVGMGVRFLDISNADQGFISDMVLDYLRSAKESGFGEPEEISIIELGEAE